MDTTKILASVLIFAILLPVIVAQVETARDDANVTGTSLSTLLSVVPLAIGIGFIVYVFRQAKVGK